MKFYIGDYFIGEAKLFLNLERKNMSIESTIKNMEASLAKKKAERSARIEARILKLKERIKSKQEKIKGLSVEVDELEAMVADLISDQNIAGTVAVTEPFVPGSGGESKDPSRKDPTKKK